MELLIWPVVTLIIVFGLVGIFYKPLKNFFERMNALKLPGGVETRVTQDQTNLIKSDKVAEVILKLFDNKLVNEQEQKIRNIISLDDINNPDDKVKIILKYSASLSIEALFEVAYAWIYGTQIQLLESINPKKEGESKSNLKVFFDSHIEMLPQPAGNNFGSYLEFLRYYNLIEFSGEQVLITLAGREFLSYLVRSGKSKDKYL